MAGVLVCVLLVHWHHVVPMQKINCSRRICCTWHRFVLRAVIQMGMFRYQDPCCLSWSWSCCFHCQNQIALSQMGTRLGQNALAGPHFPRSVLALSNSFLCLKTHLDIDFFFSITSVDYFILCFPNTVLYSVLPPSPFSHLLLLFFLFCQAWTPSPGQLNSS